MKEQKSSNYTPVLLLMAGMFMTFFLFELHRITNVVTEPINKIGKYSIDLPIDIDNAVSTEPLAAVVDSANVIHIYFRHDELFYQMGIVNDSVQIYNYGRFVGSVSLLDTTIAFNKLLQEDNE